MVGSGVHGRCQLAALVALVGLTLAAPARAAEPWQWDAPVTLFTAPAGQGVSAASEAAAMDPQGNLTVTWRDGPGHLATVTSGPGGAAPSAPVVLNSSLAGAGVPRVAATSSGGAVAAWVQFPGILERTRAGGAWGREQVAYTAPGGVTVNALDVAADATGNSILVWSETVPNVPGPGTHDRVMVLRSGAPGPDVVADPAAVAGAPAVGLDASGVATAMWTDGQTLYESHASAAAWSAARPVASAGGGESYGEPRVAVSAPGALAAVWQVDAGVSHEVHALTATGVAFAPGTVLGPSAGTADPTVALDSAGTATAAWPQAGEVVSRSRPAGGAWGATLTAIAAGVTQGAVAEGGSNAPAVAGDPDQGGGLRGVAAAFSHRPDTTPPTILVTAPTEGAVYAQGQSVAAAYTCADDSGFVSCAGPVPNGSPIDTATPGAKTFTVTATDKAGNTASASIHYTVTATPPPPPPNRKPPTGTLIGQLLARTPDGNIPNAPATDPAISWDARIDRYAAYVSAATDIVPGSGAYRNVFLVHRARPWAANGTFWHIGATTLASRGLGGAPANGDSWSPSLDGADIFDTRCLGFASAASNLVNGDTDGRANAFLLHLDTGKLARIPSKAPVTAVAIDGKCTMVAFVAGGTLYVNTIGGRTRRASPKGGVSNPGMSADGKSVSFERGGKVYGGKVGHPKKVGAGANPTGDGFGRYVAFEQGGQVVSGTIRKPHSIHSIGAGQDASMTSGGHFVFYAQGTDVRLNVKKHPVGRCPSGNAEMLAGSPHGNYVAYACTTCGVFLGYVGAQ